MKLRTISTFTLLAYTLSSPPFAAALCQIALAPFTDSTPSPDPAQASGSDALPSLVATERSFSALSVEQGMKESFLTYLGDGAIVFRPTPVDGRAAWQARDNPPGTLVWEPCYAEVSAAGDLGVSTGPWEYRPPGETDPAKIAYGHFVTIWRRQTDGSWRVALDAGGSHGPPREGGVGSGELERGPDHSSAHARAATRAAELAQLDRGLGEASRSGLSEALARAATRDLRFDRDGQQPAHGLSAARAAAKPLGGGWRFTTRGSGVARSSDLAYTYGVASRIDGGSTARADSGAYLNVWRRDDRDRWRLSLEVLNPLR